MSYHVYGVGNALVDIQAQVTDDFLEQLRRDQPAGASHTVAKGSMHLVDTAFQGHVLTLLETYEQHTVSGGSAANTMIGIAQLGGRGCYAGKVGDDVHGAFYADDLHTAGVAYQVPFGTATTGTCVILVTPDAQRTMFTHLGISIELTPDDIDEAMIRASQWVYIEGYLWDAAGPKAASLKTMEIAKRHGVRVAYSFSDGFCVRRAREDFVQFTRDYVDLVFCNEEEAQAFAQTESLDEALDHITALKTSVALTCGARGSLIAYNGTRYQIPAPRVTAVDSTGAGDLYAAGVLYGLSHGQDIEAAGRLGAQLAAEVVTVRGARLPSGCASRCRAVGA